MGMRLLIHMMVQHLCVIEDANGKHILFVQYIDMDWSP